MHKLYQIKRAETPDVIWNQQVSSKLEEIFILYRGEGRWGALQCVTVCCRVLQRVAACCSVLQRVAVCCLLMGRRRAHWRGKLCACFCQDKARISHSPDKMGPSWVLTETRSYFCKYIYIYLLFPHCRFLSRGFLFVARKQGRWGGYD